MMRIEEAILSVTLYVYMLCKNRSCILFSSIWCKYGQQQRQPIPISIWNWEKKEMTNRDCERSDERKKCYAGANNIQHSAGVSSE